MVIDNSEPESAAVGETFAWEVFVDSTDPLDTATLTNTLAGTGFVFNGTVLSSTDGVNPTGPADCSTLKPTSVVCNVRPPYPIIFLIYSTATATGTYDNFVTANSPSGQVNSTASITITPASSPTPPSAADCSEWLALTGFEKYLSCWHQVRSCPGRGKQPKRGCLLCKCLDQASRALYHTNCLACSSQQRLQQLSSAPQLANLSPVSQRCCLGTKKRTANSRCCGVAG